MLVGDQPVIFMSPAIEKSDMRLRCTLSHELGHHFIGIGGNHAGRDDEKAMRWAYNLVLPHWWIKHRLYWEPWQIAEEADVYQEWVEARLHLLWSEREAEHSRRKAVSLS